MLPNVNKACMAGKMETIEEYLRSCHVVVGAQVADTIRKTIIVQIYGGDPKNATPDDNLITRMLHEQPDKKNSIWSMRPIQ